MEKNKKDKMSFIGFLFWSNSMYYGKSEQCEICCCSYVIHNDIFIII